MHGVVYNCGPCPYLPGREFHVFHPLPETPEAVDYRALMDQRFRRSGKHLYLPICPACDACKPVRVPVADFRPRQDQRRCLRRNRDLVVSWQPRGLDDERRALYHAYQLAVHGNERGDDDAGFLIQDGGIPGGELHARDPTGRLLAVSVCDRFADALSSVYCYYDASQPRRSLGTFMALAELGWCSQMGLPWWYLGFLVRGCGKMAYKARFLPHEVLENATWVRHS